MFTDLLAEEMTDPASATATCSGGPRSCTTSASCGCPTTLLNKPGKPTDDEWVVLRAHPAHGAEIAGALLPWLGEWGAVIVEHHERYDGTGYPLGLAGREISLGARIVSVADAFDVMTAARAYKRPVSRAAALPRAGAVLRHASSTRWWCARWSSVGAPRLRRAQGVLAWLADLPLVATASVPAATVARVVGAGALATGAVAGGVGLARRPSRRRRRTSRCSTSPGTTTLGSPTAPTVAGQPTRPHGRSPRPARPVGRRRRRRSAGRRPRPAPDAGRTSRRRQRGRRRHRPVRAGSGAGDERLGSGAGTDGPTATPTPTSPRRPSRRGRPRGRGPGGHGARRRQDPVGTVTGTVDDVLADPVGTVTGTVDDTLDTVGGVLGAARRIRLRLVRVGLVGSGRARPAPARPAQRLGLAARAGTAAAGCWAACSAT